MTVSAVARECAGPAMWPLLAGLTDYLMTNLTHRVSSRPQKTNPVQQLFCVKLVDTGVGR